MPGNKNTLSLRGDSGSKTGRPSRWENHHNHILKRSDSLDTISDPQKTLVKYFHPHLPEEEKVAPKVSLLLTEPTSY